MRYWRLVLMTITMTGSLAAMGFTEDPGETLKRNFDLAPFSDLTVRGEITLEVRQGDHYSVTVQTNRALFDQLRAFSWFGFASIAVETGLLGPREAGLVQVWVTLPRLSRLTVLDQSRAIVDWPGEAATVVLRDGSTLDLSFSGQELNLQGSSKARVRVTGRVATLTLSLRQNSRLEATQLVTEQAVLTLDEQSVAQLGSVGSWRGTLRHQARAESSGPTVPSGNLIVY